MYSKPLFIFALLFCIGCNNAVSPVNKAKGNNAVTNSTENPYKVVDNIPLPEDYSRITSENNSFGSWLNKLALKKDKTVHLFDGRLKTYQGAQYAVLDVSVGNKDLQQCADAIMRLRADYLFSLNKFKEISFSDNGNDVYHFAPPYTKENLSRYLDKVFSMCGTASLAKQLKPSGIENIFPGDVLIRGGFPGHAVIIMDMAQNKEGKKIYLLAQSATPAQDIHILVNPANTTLSPWYEVNDDKFIRTPEFIFLNNEFRKW